MNKFFSIRLSDSTAVYTLVNPTYGNDGIRGRFLKDIHGTRFSPTIGLWPWDKITNFNIITNPAGVARLESFLIRSGPLK